MWKHRSQIRLIMQKRTEKEKYYILQEEKRYSGKVRKRVRVSGCTDHFTEQ
jgi:hypothetical protein